MTDEISAKDYISDQVRNRRVSVEHKGLSYPFICMDNFTMSVQASMYHDCMPREDDGPWTHFEVGFPSEKEDLLMRYAEEPSEPTKTVYDRVPAQVILDIIKKHGGLKPHK